MDLSSDNLINQLWDGEVLLLLPISSLVVFSQLVKWDLLIYFFMYLYTKTNLHTMQIIYFSDSCMTIIQNIFIVRDFLWLNIPIFSALLLVYWICSYDLRPSIFFAFTPFICLFTQPKPFHLNTSSSLSLFMIPALPNLSAYMISSVLFLSWKIFLHKFSQ